jgi:hypothetical protein
MGRKTIKLNSFNKEHGNIEFEQNQDPLDIQKLIKQSNQPEQKYKKELLAKSKCFEEFHLHPDMIRAILVKPEYTISDAKLALQKYIDSFNQ